MVRSGAATSILSVQRVALSSSVNSSGRTTRRSHRRNCIRLPRLEACFTFSSLKRWGVVVISSLNRPSGLMLCSHCSSVCAAMASSRRGGYKGSSSFVGLRRAVPIVQHMVSRSRERLHSQSSRFQIEAVILCHQSSTLSSRCNATLPQRWLRSRCAQVQFAGRYLRSPQVFVLV